MSRYDLGSNQRPVIAGNDLVIEAEAVANSGDVFDYAGVAALTYAVFRMDGDLPVSTPTFTLGLGSGVAVTSGAGGMSAITMTASISAQFSGRDWHVFRYVGSSGKYDIFEGVLVSTRALSF